MVEAFCVHLLKKPNLYTDEMAVFLRVEFDIHATKSNISRAFTFKGWSKNAARQTAKERNLGLRDKYFNFIHNSIRTTWSTWMNQVVING